VSQGADRLRVARERAGLSIEEIAARTKIRAATLIALERGQYDQLPGDFYTRAYLRAYAREVGHPEEGILQEYDELRGATEPELAPIPAEPPPQPPRPSTRRPHAPVILRWPSRYTTPVVLFFTVALLVALLGFGPTGASRSATAAGSSEVGVADAAPAAVGTSGRVAAPDRLVVDIRPAAPVWVAATADGASAVYRLLQPGERVMVEGKRTLSFRIGNAGAFEYSINGVAGKPLGGPDEVREFHITPENYQTYRR
jgi:cytoskeleton protein RodZ